VRKKPMEQDAMLDPAYWHLLPDERRNELQTDLEDTLEAALDEGAPAVADEKFWRDLRAEFVEKVKELEAAKKKNARG
jgi:hypothetical protein